MATEVAVGIDIGTTSVKAVAADGDGNVVARARVPRVLKTSHAGELAHDARSSWRDGVQAALDEVLSTGADLAVQGVEVAAMVPSLCAVDGSGVPISDGLLYGDARGAGGEPGLDPSSSGELVRFLASLTSTHPEAAGYWPAQAVANHALCGRGAIDTTVAMTTVPLFDYTGWDPTVAAGAGVTDLSKLPDIVVGVEAVGRVPDAGGAPLGGGTIDALGEQLVAGAVDDGDVLVILGGTLIVWAVVPEWVERPGVWTVPHTVPGKVLIGGPSNAGGLFLSWADRVLAAPASTGEADLDPGGVPIWQPYLRGERVPYHDPERRASLHDLHVGLDASAVRRAAHEASGFAVRHILDLAGVTPRRIVATGGGVYDPGWVQALADTVSVPVDVVAVPEGAALGAAWLARQVAGLEEFGADGTRWARTGRRVDPRSPWVDRCAERYARYRDLAG